MINEKLHPANIQFELQERRKELQCMYEVESILLDAGRPLDIILNELVHVLPAGWQYPEVCGACIEYYDESFQSPKYKKTYWMQKRDLAVNNENIGSLQISYDLKRQPSGKNIFLPEEEALITSIAGRLEQFFLHYHIANAANILERSSKFPHAEKWRTVLDMLRRTDSHMFITVTIKYLRHLFWRGNSEAERLLRQYNNTMRAGKEDDSEENKPLKRVTIDNYDEYVENILELVGEHIEPYQILEMLQNWLQQDKSNDLVNVLKGFGSSIAEISEALRKFFSLAPEKLELSQSIAKGLRVSLIRRFFTEDLDYISVAKEFVKLTDFHRLIDRMIFMPDSHGKLGGKSFGLFLASSILQSAKEESDLLDSIKIPKTWYLTSDCLGEFLQYNNLDEISEQKYKHLDEIKLEYPHLIQIFKNSEFPPDMVKGFSVLLDDIGNKPIVVRSSGLLEDQLGASFSGKYKSLFLANQGTKEERLNALMDAVAEVYASTFAPGPIEYRAERDLLDFHEEMGVMIMEVVGSKIGDYYFPAISGAALSMNEFRWSDRLKTEDGLMMLSPGLGTKMVDRMSENYPVLVAPGNPDVKIKQTFQEFINRAPKIVDIINLETNEFETVPVKKLLEKYGCSLPMIHSIVSYVKDGKAHVPAKSDTFCNVDKCIITFQGLLQEKSFVSLVDTLLKTLQRKMQIPVQIEFASDGVDFYLLQCKPQVLLPTAFASVLPQNIPENRLIFQAEKHLSGGCVRDLSHIVYINQKHFIAFIKENSTGKICSVMNRLNVNLPRKSALYIVPGVTEKQSEENHYLDFDHFSNAAMITEFYQQRSSYTPEFSLGTIYFQDMIKRSVRYMPIFLDDTKTNFNAALLNSLPNVLSTVTKESQDVEHVIKVIDIQKEFQQEKLNVLMTAQSEFVSAFIQPHDLTMHREKESFEAGRMREIEHWRWRCRIAEKIAASLDGDYFGIKAFYVFGSTKNANAGPKSDIDLLIHIDSERFKKSHFQAWINGWDKSIAYTNYLKTGMSTDGLLDLHYVSDEDIKNRTSFAVKIGAISDAARKLLLKNDI